MEEVDEEVAMTEEESQELSREEDIVFSSSRGKYTSFIGLGQY